MDVSHISRELDDLVLAHRILSAEGQQDRTSGHLSWRDPDGRGFWMKRAYIGMDEMRDQSDLVLINFDGQKIYGDGAAHREWAIHGEILRSRPELNAVGHTHAFYSQLFAATSERLKPVVKEGTWFEDLPRFKETSCLILTAELGRRLAATLGGADAVFMLSHGMAFVGRTLRECLMVGIYVEAAVRGQLTVEMTGVPYTYPDPADARAKREQTRTPHGIDNYWNYLVRHVAAATDAS